MEDVEVDDASAGEHNGSKAVSVGDALGERFFRAELRLDELELKVDVRCDARCVRHLRCPRAESEMVRARFDRR